MSREECHKAPYLVPQLYVEGEASDKFLEIVNDTGRITDRCSHRDALCLGKKIYGSEIDFIDLVSKRVLRSFVVLLPPSYERGLLLSKGSAIEPIPVEGVRVALEVCEGVKVRKWDTLGLVLTRKREVRRIKAHVPGVVVYIYSPPIGDREENIVIIAPEEVVRYIRVQH